MLYEIKNGYFTGVVSGNGSTDPKLQYTKIAPPELSSGEYAIWVGKWIKTATPPMPPEPKYDPTVEKLLWNGTAWQVLPISTSETVVEEDTDLDTVLETTEEPVTTTEPPSEVQ